MLDIKQKQNILGAGALVLILAIITLTSKSEFGYKEEPLPENPNQSVVDAKSYLRYLQSLNIDQKASKDLFQKIITESEIKAEVENELQVNQTISQPLIDSSKLVKAPQEGKQATVDYLAKVTGSALNFNTEVKQQTNEVFSGDQESAAELHESLKKTLAEFYKIPAPTEARGLQESIVKAFTAYGKLLEASLAKAKGEGESPWPQLYNQYAVINEQFQTTNQEVIKLTDKYQIASLEIQPVYAFGSEPRQFKLVKEAHAFLGIGDVTITVGDIPRIIKEAIEEGLTTSFANFMGAMLNKLIAKIESNYLIANFLYYTDALIAGQYTDDYLQKYVSDQVDRQIVKRFIPQFACGASPGDLAGVFQAKAQEYLGFDASSLRPSDPDYYNKLSRVGAFMASPSGWQQYYEGVAAEAKTEAEKAAERELTSPGLKTPRDTINSAIAISVNNIVSASRASLNSLMNLGVSTAKSFVSGFVSQLTQNLVNKFVFRGVVSQGGSLGVLKEQKTCVAAAQYSLVLPTEATTYEAPPAPPTQEELLEGECAKYPRGCTVLPNNDLNPGG